MPPFKSAVGSNSTTTCLLAGIRSRESPATRCFTQGSLSPRSYQHHLTSTRSPPADLRKKHDLTNPLQRLVAQQQLLPRIAWAEGNCPIRPHQFLFAHSLPQLARLLDHLDAKNNSHIPGHGEPRCSIRHPRRYPATKSVWGSMRWQISACNWSSESMLDE